MVIFHFTLNNCIHYVQCIIFCIVGTGDCENLVHDKYKSHQKKKILIFLFNIIIFILLFFKKI